MQREHTEVEMREHEQTAGERRIEEERQAAVNSKLRAALGEAEPGGLTSGCSDFGAEFFRQVERCGCVQADKAGDADADEIVTLLLVSSCLF